MIIKPCPVCGKQPIISDTGIYTWRIQCKPIFQKPHIMIEGYSQYTPDGYREAVTEWNKKVEEYKGVNHGTEGENH